MPTVQSPAPWTGRRLHLIGIGGVGMSGLALVGASLGAEVTGSDRHDSPHLARLRDAGLDPIVGHAAANVPDGAEVVVSTAIGEDNEELRAARASGLPVLHRGDLLGEVSRLRRTIAVAGAHGKTTTASMIAHALMGAGQDPSYLVGGTVRSTGRGAAWGDGEWAVIEADESDRSFLKLSHELAVITNVELDHHATWRTVGELREGFARFAAGARIAILWLQLVDGPDPVLRRDATSGPGLVTFGIGEGDLAASEVQLGELGSRFTVGSVEVELRVPGRHNVLNALAALAACRAAGVELATAASALATFSGASRRFEAHGATPSGARVFDDYAHHPTEVGATLEAARQLAAGRLVACFQPHLFSRTRHLAREFGRALALADVVCVLDVYPDRERPEDHPGVSGWSVAAAAADAAHGRPVYWLPSLDDAERLLARELRESDVILTMGAGDVYRLAHRLADGSEASR